MGPSGSPGGGFGGAPAGERWFDSSPKAFPAPLSDFGNLGPEPTSPCRRSRLCQNPPGQPRAGGGISGSGKHGDGNRRSSHPGNFPGYPQAGKNKTLLENDTAEPLRLGREEDAVGRWDSWIRDRRAKPGASGLRAGFPPPGIKGDTRDEPDPARRERRRPPPPLRTANASSTPSPAPNRGLVSASRDGSYNRRRLLCSALLYRRGSLFSSSDPFRAHLTPKFLLENKKRFHRTAPCGFEGAVGIHVPPLPRFGEGNKAAPRALHHPEMKTPPRYRGDGAGPPPTAPSCGGQGSPCLFTAGGERADIVWTGAGRGGCGRKNGRGLSRPGPPGVGKARYWKTKRVFPEPSPFPTPFFFFFLGGSARSHLHQHGGKTPAPPCFTLAAGTSPGWKSAVSR